MTACDPCPNVPRCPHPGTMHDIEDYDDLRPMCCAEGCTCGNARHPQAGSPAYPSVGDPKSSQVNGT